MRLPPAYSAALAALLIQAEAQSSISFSNSDITTLTSISTEVPGSSYHYITSDGQSTVSVDSSSTSSHSNSSITGSSQRETSTSATLTQVVGGTSGLNATTRTSSTSTGPAPTNLTPCNGYPELCNRKYSNITEVCAHNAAFVVKNNAASNQNRGIYDQLDDGVRMIQGETQLVNGTIYSCHTSCDLLNAGTYESELAKIASWLQDNPYDVVTILIANSGFQDGVGVNDYVDSIQGSGLGPYLYEPEFVPQRKDQWPTLGEMILSGKRAVIFMDYNANQTEVPYVLDQYSHMWETPFSPTNQTFPCTIERPPDLNETLARDDYMYLANHNLNTRIAVAGFDFLVPNTAEINFTNGAMNEFGQLEAMRLNCTRDWDRPPNFLVVDYYEYGYPEQGSVFEVAARANNVTYNGRCCGETKNDGLRMERLTMTSIFVVLIATIWIL